MTNAILANTLVTEILESGEVEIPDSYLHDDMFFDLIIAMVEMMSKVSGERLGSYINFDFDSAMQKKDVYALPPNPEHRRLILRLSATCVAEAAEARAK